MYGGKINLFTAGMVGAACLACFIVGVLFLWRRRYYRTTSYYVVFCGIVIFTLGSVLSNFGAALGYAGIAWMPDLFFASRCMQVVGVSVIVGGTSYGQPGGLRACAGVLLFSILGGFSALLLPLGVS